MDLGIPLSQVSVLFSTFGHRGYCESSSSIQSSGRVSESIMFGSGRFQGWRGPRLEWSIIRFRYKRVRVIVGV